MGARVPGHRPPRAGPNRHREYDRTDRNEESKRFYHSSAWLRLRRVKLARNGLCELCIREKRVAVASHVHHVQDLVLHPELGLNLDNLQSLCHACHSRLHAFGRETG